MVDFFWEFHDAFNNTLPTVATKMERATQKVFIVDGDTNWGD